MTRKTTKIVAMLLGVFLCITNITVPAHAAETKDTAFSFTVSGTAGCTSKRTKTNSTPVYVYYDKGIYEKIRVSAWGYMVTDDADLAALAKNRTRCNGKYVNYVYVQKEITTSIRTYLYETNCYEDVHLKIQSHNASSKDTVSGVWSPDSTRVYTDATTS